MAPEDSEGTIPFDVQGEILYTGYKIFAQTSRSGRAAGTPGIMH
jgi:hypothetical protein